MAKGGRYGKYGEQKRFERLKQKRKSLLNRNPDPKGKKKPKAGKGFFETKPENP